ncbi:PP0621 family protein [Thermotomaculum hydrothermale]|uniref:PP0621 family protein n=1 Tax=Thermotomaculum hydrothermale TaxID=981385 RepID=UPI001915AE0A|nr:PP0621 family protein [Thermotomaculum hydrothermale]
MLKLLIFFGFLFGIFYFFYYKIRKFFMDILYPEQKAEETKNQRESVKNKGEMVKCPVCNTYFPENTGIKKNGKLYCSVECLEKDNQ